MSELTHLDAQGRAHMVDVGEKPVTRRMARVLGSLEMKPETRETLLAGNIKKGDAIATARIAGIMAAKQTGALIPLCHPIGLDSVEVEFAYPENAPTQVWVRATATCTGRTGVEMEAMVAASTACLTIYDMCKAIDRSMVMNRVYLARKTGGRSGDFEHPEHVSLSKSVAESDWS